MFIPQKKGGEKEKRGKCGQEWTISSRNPPHVKLQTKKKKKKKEENFHFRIRINALLPMKIPVQIYVPLTVQYAFFPNTREKGENEPLKSQLKLRVE